MEALIHPPIPRAAVRGTLAIVFWIVAAVLVLAVHLLAPGPAAAITILRVAAVVFAGFVYVRLAARTATLGQALAVGIVWLLLDITAELCAATMLGHGWFELLGPPSKPALRDLMLVTWIVAPAIFVRRGEDA